MSAVTGAPPSTGPGPRIAGIGSFSTMRPDGTVVLTVPVTQLSAGCSANNELQSSNDNSILRKANMNAQDSLQF